MNLNHESAVVKQSFEIEYAVFFNRAAAALNRDGSNPDSRLVKGRTRRRGGGGNGAWLSSSSSAASLFLFTYTSRSPLLLLISLDGEIREEHLVTKLQISWPQILQNLTPSGSRVVIASYKDSAGQMQKFAMRFLDSSQSLLFIDTLKESMDIVGNIQVPRSPAEVHPRAARRRNPARTSSDDNLLVQPLRVHDLENIHTEAVLLHLVKHLPGSTFNAFLCEIEKVMSNLEGEQ